MTTMTSTTTTTTTTTVWTRTATTACAQAFLSYGPKGNDELLQLFGFVEIGNQHDTFLAVGLAEYAVPEEYRREVCRHV